MKNSRNPGNSSEKPRNWGTFHKQRFWLSADKAAPQLFNNRCKMYNKLRTANLTLLLIIWIAAGCAGPADRYHSKSLPALQSSDPHTHLNTAKEYLFKFIEEKASYLENIDIVIRESKNIVGNDNSEYTQKPDGDMEKE